MTRLVGRAVRDLVAASPGSGTYAALLAGVAIEAAVVPGLAALGAAVGGVALGSSALGAVVGAGHGALVGGLAVGYGVGDGRGSHALGHPATWAYAVLPLLARWVVALEVLEWVAGADAVLLGDTTFLVGVVTPLAVVGATAGSALAPAPAHSGTAGRDDRDRGCGRD